MAMALPDSSEKSRDIAGRLRETAVPAFAGAAVTVASLVNFLNHNQYPLFRPEIGLILGALLAIVLVAWLLYAGCGRIVRAVMQILLVYLALDLNFDGPIVPIATAGIALILNRHMMPFIGIVSSIVLLTNLTGAAVSGPGPALRPTITDSSANPPILLHIILDEHIGIEGLLGDDPKVVAMRERLKAFYIDKGFRLFGGAYSEYMQTVNSIPQVFNFGEEQAWNPSNRIRSTISSNAYFDLLGTAGYQIYVSQTDYLNYCENGFVVHCRTRRAADLASIADASLATSDKAEIVAIQFAQLSQVLLVSMVTHDVLSDRFRVRNLPPLGALETLERLPQQLRSATPGSAYVVHELLPHSPYALTGSCRLKEFSRWKSRRHGPDEERMDAYLEQLSCLLSKIEPILAAVGSNAIVVLHGDHGSRITNTNVLADKIGVFADADLVVGHSTLFAVRAPDISPGYDRRPLPIAQILRQLAMSGFHSAQVSVPDLIPSVVLADGDWKPVVRHPLPDGWPAPEGR
ncbi:MAG: hypothetical protein IT539_10645 [Bradyrhizobiaceae bacterium]|nr:hypothetical protein [Bradyrhizobiaceae bacterium]